MIRVLVSAFVACVVLLTVSYVRIVQAEDDCAMGTYMVERTPLGLVCIWEPTL